MNNKNITIIFFATLLLAGSVSCRKSFLPSTQIDENSALTNEGDVETATIGTYALFKNAGYVRSGHFLMEYPSDEVAQGQNSSDDLTRCYRYTHLVTGGHATNFWSQAYLAASAANRIIRSVADDASPGLLQLKGENLFIRAMLHFNLVRIFGRPYSQNSGENLGVPILNENLTEEEIEDVSRSSVKQVYEFIVADLLKAEQLMTVEKSNSFASKQVAQALLARVYLYMENEPKAIEYANLVIGSTVPGAAASGKYNLLQGSDFQSYFRGVPESNKETIFGIRHMKTEDRGYSAIGSMYYSGDATGNAQNQAFSGWGEIYASKKYVDFLNENPADLRKSFISPYSVSGALQYNTKLTPNTPMYYLNKYNLQEGIINLSSPVYLRLAEMYLIRAEANAKEGNDQLALDDVNVLRTRAGIPTYAIGVITGSRTALDIVLEERWLELAFEGHRSYDLFRNGKPVVRNYPGSQVVNGNVNQTINPGDDRVVFFIPQTEIDKNPSLQQNP